MTKPRSYLDHNATTPLHPSAREAMSAAFEAYGNPSSLHSEGRQARSILDHARREVALMTGVAVEDVIFTSCGTEGLNIVLTPELTIDGRGFDHLLMGAGEHPAVLAGHRFGVNAETLPLTSNGMLDLAALEAAQVRLAGRRVMLALQAANNETGVIQPVAEAAALVHARGGYVVCDAVQAAGKISCDIKALGADALAISAHKFGGPKGVGALCFAPSRHHLKQGVVRGAGHERGLKAGTENVVGIAGLGAACAPAEMFRQELGEQVELWRQAIERSVRDIVPGAAIVGDGAPRLPNTVCFVAPGLDARTLLMNLDLEGVAVSAGSACASGKMKPSHVLRAMGVEAELATTSLRVSLGWTTQGRDIEAFADALAKAVKNMRPRIAA